MGLFKNDEKKFKELVRAIDERLGLYEKLVNEAPSPHPKGLLLVYQEFRNLKIRAWDIETGDDASKHVKRLSAEEALEESERR